MRLAVGRVAARLLPLPLHSVPHCNDNCPVVPRLNSAHRRTSSRLWIRLTASLRSRRGFLLPTSPLDECHRYADSNEQSPEQQLPNHWPNRRMSAMTPARVAYRN